MSKALNTEQLLEILQLISKSYGMEHGVKRPIKYADFDFDNRTKDYYHIRLRGWGGWEKSFHVMNEQRTAGPIYDRVIEFLKTCL